MDGCPGKVADLQGLQCLELATLNAQWLAETAHITADMAGIAPLVILGASESTRVETAGNMMDENECLRVAAFMSQDREVREREVGGANNEPPKYIIRVVALAKWRLRDSRFCIGRPMWESVSGLKA
jgi:hypothetical protein